MIDSVPLRAPTSPPETGASILPTPRAAAASWISIASDGSLVVMSTRTDPAAAPETAPCPPRNTSRTSAGNPTMAKVTSDAAATAAGVSAQVAPAASSAPAFLRVLVWTVIGYPADCRCPHIDVPITPVPIHPTDVVSGFTPIDHSCPFTVCAECTKRRQTEGSVAGRTSSPSNHQVDA